VPPGAVQWTKLIDKHFLNEMLTAAEKDVGYFLLVLDGTSYGTLCKVTRRHYIGMDLSYYAPRITHYA